jgi:hypothetical protein|tara:strand:+ start:1167 stop:1388 length:222 start_codon:yes stop_codon:yes gene_type:complete
MPIMNALLEEQIALVFKHTKHACNSESCSDDIKRVKDIKEILRQREVTRRINKYATSDIEVAKKRAQDGWANS